MINLAAEWQTLTEEELAAALVDQRWYEPQDAGLIAAIAKGTISVEEATEIAENSREEG